MPDYERIRKLVAERIGAEGTDAFSLPTEIDKDSVVALQFPPDGETPQPPNQQTGRDLSNKEVSKILAELDVTPFGIRIESYFRISIAGAQQKTTLLCHDDQWIESTGTTPATHIIRPQIGTLSDGMDQSKSVENEYICLKIMETFELQAAQAEITQFGKNNA